MASTPAGRMLTRQLQQMQSAKDIPGISCGLVDNNIFEWEVMLMISDECKYYGGMHYTPSATITLSQDAYANGPLIYSYRWVFPCPPLLPTGVPSHASQDEI